MYRPSSVGQNSDNRSHSNLSHFFFLQQQWRHYYSCYYSLLLSLYWSVALQIVPSSQKTIWYRWPRWQVSWYYSPFTLFLLIKIQRRKKQINLPPHLKNLQIATSILPALIIIIQYAGRKGLSNMYVRVKNIPVPLLWIAHAMLNTRPLTEDRFFTARLYIQPVGII